MEILTDCYSLKEIYLDNTTAENYTIEEYTFITENNYQIEDWVLLALDTGSLRDAQIHLQLKGEIVKVYRHGVKGPLCSEETIKETKGKILLAYKALLKKSQ